MPFKIVTKATIGSRILENEIRMGWHKASHKASTRTIYISVSRGLINEVGWEVQQGNADGSNADNRFYTSMALMEGTYDDAGFIMLVEHWERDGYRLGNNKGASSTTAFSCGVSHSRLTHYVINDADQEVDPKPVEFTIDKEAKTILIECPDWLRYNPQSVPELPKEPEPPPMEVKKETPAPRPTRLPTIKEIARDQLKELELHDDDGKPFVPNRTMRRRIATQVAQKLR